MIFDDFFADPVRVREIIHAAEMKDIEYSDGVTYPNITLLPEEVEKETIQNLESVFGPITPVISFARYSFAGGKPPHWAHSDREIAEFLALIYLSHDGGHFGTSVLNHKEFTIDQHPDNDFGKKVLLEDANRKEAWKIVYTCPSKFNRLFVLNADLIHAAMGEYGKDKDDGRLVISVFFNLGRAQ